MTYTFTLGELALVVTVVGAYFALKAKIGGLERVPDKLDAVEKQLVELTGEAKACRDDRARTRSTFERTWARIEAYGKQIAVLEVGAKR